ncbi:MAG: SUMO ligase siz1 [Peltula sp. TS41687]|nr:MAG: SUMO ligase siz1 [Peltula sp. TS41687]
MASGKQTLDRHDVSAATSKVKGLLNRHLITILKEARLSHTGTKSIMQARIINYLESLEREGNADKFNRIRSLIYNPDSPSSSSTTGGSPRSGPYLAAASSHMANAMHNNRHTVSSPLRLRKDVVDKLNADPTTRVMVYCASDSTLAAYTKLNVSFPHQIEMKVNHEDVKGNVRGLKNKPGTTRPLDITGYLRKIENYENTFSMTYALTQKGSQMYSFMINLVKSHSIDDLVETLKKGKIISKEKVISEMQSRAQDTDIVATSTIMSLKFCQKLISFEALAVDEYVKDILNSTPKSLEQVTIEPNGEWSQITAPSPSAARPNDNSTMIQASTIDDDDDDLLEIIVKSNGINNHHSKTSTPSAPKRLLGTPSLSGSVSRSTSNKRPVGSVIDLTLSDDEVDRPRPAKRQATMDKPNTPSAGGMLSVTSGSGGATNGTVNGSGGWKTSMNLTLPTSTSTPITTQRPDGLGYGGT